MALWQRLFSFCGLFGFATISQGQFDTVTVIDGVRTNIRALYSSGTNNLVILTNGAGANITTFASQSTARSNALIITASSFISNNLTFAGVGRSNALLFQNGGF